MNPQTWHALSVSEVADAFSTNTAMGLTSVDAVAKSAKGKNRLPDHEHETSLTRILRQFKSPIALLLIIAAIATLFVSHYTDALVIAVALLVNVVMGAVQEGRASRAFEALQKGEAHTAVVIRGGEAAKVRAEDLVEGDVVALLSGSAVPADMRLFEAHNLMVNEAALSGEWLPVEKTIDAAEKDAALVERSGMAYAGTLVVSGAGKGIVVAIGKDTEIGAIASELQNTRRAETPLMKDIKEVARFLVFAVLIVVIGIGVLGVLRGISFEETLFTAIALAVASVPEGLPAAVTVVLALGMERILKKGGLVRSLVAAETLGTTSIILTDKTGTLTEGQMTLDSFMTHRGLTKGGDHEEARELLFGAVLASDAYVEERKEAKEGEERLVAHGRPVEQAVVLAGMKLGLTRNICLKGCERVDELHFDSERRFGGMLVIESNAPVAYLTGAPELFLAHAKRLRYGDTVVEFSGEVRSEFTQALEGATREGKRVVSVMRVPTTLRAFPEKDFSTFLEEGELLGFLIFSDAVRPEVSQSIRDIQHAGARVLMLTGDNPETALSIARSVGIAGDADRAYIGKELSTLSDEELLRVLKTNSVFARIAPTEKLRIAQVLVAAGEVVAMTGDGVNDAPALSAASIGVSVGSGTDVAKEASALVLLTNGFGVITAAIAEGRRLRDNFKKIFAYMLSTNFSEVILIAFSLIFALPLPILPTQILWSNLIEGGLMNFAFAFEPLHPSAMKRKPTDPDIRRVLSGKLIKLILMVGTVTATLLIGIYLWLLNQGITGAELNTYMFIGVSVNSIFMAFSMKSFGTPVWRTSLLSNKFLLFSLFLATVALLAALYLPFVQALVKTTEPSGLTLLIFIGFGIVNLATIEFAKWLFFIRTEERVPKIA